MGLSFERPICDATGVTLQITKVVNSSCDLHGWLWVEVTEELWDASHDENTKNKANPPSQNPLFQLPSTQLPPSHNRPTQLLPIELAPP